MCWPPSAWSSPSRSRCGSATRASSGFGVTAKDLILATIGQIGVAGAVGHVVEYAGPAIEALSMEGRMTVCNMTIEAGGRAGMIAPDETTFEWVIGRPGGPGRGPGGVARAVHRRRVRRSTARSSIDASAISPMVTWGTNPGMVVGGDRRGPGAAVPSRTSARCTTWGSRPGRRSRRSSSTVCSSAPARTPGSATCAPPRRWSGPPGRRRRLRDGGAGVGPGQGAGRARGPRRRLPGGRALTGAAPAARCAWA